MPKISLILILFINIAFAKAQNTLNLPINTKPKSGAKQIIFYLSGDGGMNTFSQSITQSLNEKNYALVCLDSKKYFWEQKTPDKLAQDLNSLIAYYLKAWNQDEFSILGYSFGADASLFLIPRLSKELQGKLKAAVLLSPSTSSDFVIKLTDMMGFGNKEAKYKTIPEIYKINIPLLLIFGKEEDGDIHKSFPEKKNLNKILIPGSHKFNNDIPKVVSTIQSGL